MNEIKIGQEWKEVDSRFVRIIEVVGFCDKKNKVIIKTVVPYTGRLTKASRERFSGKSGGYKLHVYS